MSWKNNIVQSNAPKKFELRSKKNRIVAVCKQETIWKNGDIGYILYPKTRIVVLRPRLSRKISLSAFSETILTVGDKIRIVDNNTVWVFRIDNIATVIDENNDTIIHLILRLDNGVKRDIRHFISKILSFFKIS